MLEELRDLFFDNVENLSMKAMSVDDFIQHVLSINPTDYERKWNRQMTFEEK